MLKVLEDAEVAAVLSPAGGPLPFVVEGGGEQEGEEPDPSEEGARVMISFLQWYYEPSQTPRREAIEGRINRCVGVSPNTPARPAAAAHSTAPSATGGCARGCGVMLQMTGCRQIASMEASVRKGQEKAASKRSKRLKQLQERQSKAASLIDHTVAVAEDKRRIRQCRSLPPTLHTLFCPATCEGVDGVDGGHCDLD